MGIIKLIICRVKTGQKENFSRGQLAWKELSNCDGFYGQYGGWTLNGDAIVLGEWRSMNHVTDFMNFVHDNIDFKSEQHNTYYKCDVHYFESIFNINSLKSDTLNPNCSVIRLAYCRKVQDIECFMREQKNIWNPGMERTEGFLGGSVARSLSQSDYFIVITRWSSITCHEKYIKNVFPTLKEQTLPENYIGDLSGCLVQEECLWRVAPNKKSM